MGGYYRLGSYDARRLATMIGALSTDRSRVGRAGMALFCWSQMQAKGKPCPLFRVGYRTIARECDVTPRAAQKFVEKAVELGFIVELGEEVNRDGKYVKRTFSWVAEEAADDAGMDLGEWLRKVGGCNPNGLQGCNPTGLDVGAKSQQVGLQGCNPTPCESDTHQSTEYSEGGARSDSPSTVESGAFPIVTADGLIIPPKPDGWA